MRDQKDIDLMLENFLSDNSSIPDQGFSEQVLANLPVQSQLFWLKDLLRSFILFSALLALWKWNFFGFSKLLGWLRVLDLSELSWTQMSFSLSWTMITGLLLVAASLFYEKFIEET